MSKEISKKISDSIVNGMEWSYEVMSVSREDIIKTAVPYDARYSDWDYYQKNASMQVMDDIAESYIAWAKVKVSGLGVATGAGGLGLIVPDTLQFLAFTLRMVSGIAGAYGFAKSKGDKDTSEEGVPARVKTLAIEAYYKGLLKKEATSNLFVKGGERAAINFVKKAAMRTNVIMKFIVKIGQILGIRVTRNMLLKSIPFIASGANGVLNWHYANTQGSVSRSKIKELREGIRRGDYSPDDWGFPGDDSEE